LNIPDENVPNDAALDHESLVSSKLLARRWWILGAVILCTAISTTAAFVIAPVYRATILMMPAGAERDGLRGSLSSALGQLGGLASLAGINPASNNSETVESVAVLRSRQFTENFIADKNLMPKLFPDLWDPSVGAWRVAEADQPTAGKAYHKFDKKVRTIIQDAKTGLITLQIDWTNRVEAAELANDLVARLNAEMRRRAIAKADASVGFLGKELATTNDLGTREAINHLIESEIKQRMLANVMQEYALRVIGKAMVPEMDDLAPPRRIVVILAGPPIGLLVGIAVVLLQARIKEFRDRRQITARNV
jgi:uncharacterized protein involved in exopolysaccharide biosynthesis